MSERAATLPSPLPAGGRNAALDTIRGGLLVIMALNHIPSVFWRLTQQPFGFVTAAEGFVFLAGLVVGLIYSKRWEKLGAKTTSRALITRAFVIYKAHLACIIGILLWMHLYVRSTGSPHPPVGSPWLWMQKPWESLLATLFLVQQPGLLDVLPTYFGFLMITPLVLWALMRGKFKTVFSVSFTIWALTNYFDPPRPTVIGMINTGAFNFGAWQFLYVMGTIAGVAWAKGLLPVWQPRKAVIAFLIAAVALLSACSHQWLTLGLSHETWFTLTNKNNLAPVRVINVALLIVLAYYWLRGRRDDLGLPSLALLGRHSLAVFSVHCVVAMVILGLPQWFDWHPYGPMVGPFLIVGIMMATAGIAEAFDQARKTAKSLREEKPLATTEGS